MGSYDGAEVCELVGLFILHQLPQLVGVKNIGHYRNDGLAMLKNISGPTSERIKKKIIKLLHQYSLNITTETNLVQTNFLDVTFNLKSGKYWPYHKANDQTLYVHQHSNYPPAIMKLLSSTLSDRLFLLLCKREEFASRRMKRLCAEADIPVSCSTTAHPAPIRKRKAKKKNIVLFNPPFSGHEKLTSARFFFTCLPNTFLSIIACTRSAIKLCQSDL